MEGGRKGDERTRRDIKWRAGDQCEKGEEGLMKQESDNKSV